MGVKWPTCPLMAPPICSGPTTSSMGNDWNIMWFMKYLYSWKLEPRHVFSWHVLLDSLLHFPYLSPIYSLQTCLIVVHTDPIHKPFLLLYKEGHFQGTFSFLFSCHFSTSTSMDRNLQRQVASMRKALFDQVSFSYLHIFWCEQGGKKQFVLSVC